jgi:hypothetical protein
LWNIAYLTTNNLNFSPIYIASGEDVSFGGYFDTKKIPYLYYEGIGVRKELVGYHDNSDGAKKVNEARDSCASWFAEEEAKKKPAVLSPPAQPAPTVELPPPVEVKPTAAEDTADGVKVKTLADFIENNVLPKSQLKDEGNDKDEDKAKAKKALILNNAKCQGVEQITCGAIKNGIVTDAALITTFQINGNKAQEVKRYLPKPKANE